MLLAVVALMRSRLRSQLAVEAARRLDPPRLRRAVAHLQQAGGIRPQLTVVVDLDSLLGHPGAVGGDLGWAAPLSSEACRRLACDGAVTRVLVTRHPGDDHGGGHHDPDDEHGLAARLRTAMALLPPILGWPTVPGNCMGPKG